MRLAAQMRGGFYPAPAAAVAHAATFLRPPHDEPFTMLDPCAGEGAAIRQLGGLLGCPQTRTFAIELDESRAQTLQALLPEANILAPANFLSCRASLQRFSFIWLNPPFDDGYGGHRVEEQFLRTATDWLMPGGVMALVCPEDVADEYSDVRHHFLNYYQYVFLVPFPAEHRPFNEVIVFGHKRPRLIREQQGDERPSWAAVQAPHHFRYYIPPGTGPKTFQKVEPTEAELQRMLANSPLRDHLLAAPEAPLPSPPLALGIGHVALLLASGQLDGIVHPQGKAPHVVRGTSRKHQYVADIADTVNPDGSITTKTIIAERIQLVVRTVDWTGQLRTFRESDDAEE